MRQGEVPWDLQAIEGRVGDAPHLKRRGNTLVNLANRVGSVHVEINELVDVSILGTIDSNHELFKVVSNGNEPHPLSFECLGYFILSCLNGKNEKNVLQ